MRTTGKPLHLLTQDLESRVHKTYLTAIPNRLALLLKVQFIDALDSANIKVQIKQAQSGTMQLVLARALEFESYIKSSTGNFRVSYSSEFQANIKKIRETKGIKNSRRPCKKNEEINGVCY